MAKGLAVYEWHESYAVGVDSIDAQHITLFQSARELHRAFREGHSRTAIPKALHHLVVYCINHLDDEEHHMKRAGYPNLQEHIEEHRRLSARVFDFQDRYQRGEAAAAMEVSSLIVEWLKQHIREHDQRFAEFLRSCREQA